MSRRKQAKPQHLKSDEELPPPDGAPEHGEGPRIAGRPGVWRERGPHGPGKCPGSREPVPAVWRSARARPAWGSGPPPERAAREFRAK